MALVSFKVSDRLFPGTNARASLPPGPNMGMQEMLHGRPRRKDVQLFNAPRSLLGYEPKTRHGATIYANTKALIDPSTSGVSNMNPSFANTQERLERWGSKGGSKEMRNTAGGDRERRKKAQRDMRFEFGRRHAYEMVTQQEAPLLSMRSALPSPRSPPS